MKYFSLAILLLAFLLVSCSKKEDVKLELFSPEAMAFDTGTAWDVNMSIRVKGYQQNESNGKFNAQLSYQVDLVKPGGETLKGLVTKVEDRSESEKVSDTQINIQFELDSTYKAGTYKVMLNVKDELSGGKASNETNLELKKD